MAVERVALEAENRIKQVLIQRIKDKALELGRVPRQSDFTCWQRFYAVFGSWNEALRAAGFPVAKVSLRLKYRYLQGQDYKPTKDDCIESLKRLSEMLRNCRPTSDNIESELGMKAGCPKLTVIKRIFGTLENALREAGLDRLPTRREKEEYVQIDPVLESRVFLLSSELKDRRARKHARERGVPIVHDPKNRNLLTVLDWMRGVERKGILPTHEEIRSAMGDRAFQYLKEYCQGLSLRDIGEKNGLSKERVRQIMNKGASAAVRKISKICLDRRQSVMLK